MLKVLSSLLFCLCLSLPAGADEAQPPAPQDFASGVQITGADTGQPLYRIDLPVDALYGTAWPDLRDLRVFNGQGEAVPFWLLRPERPTSQEQSVALRIFPLPAKTETGSEGKLVVRTDRQQIELTLPGGETEEHRTAATYLLELEQDDSRPALARLRFDWKRTDTNWQGRVTVLGSNDLSDWEMVGAGTLADLKSDQSGLRISEITLSHYRTKWRYWLVRFDDSSAPTLASVAGIHAEQVAKIAPLALSMSGQRISPTEYEFALPQALPLAGLRIELPVMNAVANVELATRSAEKHAWSPLGASTLYRFNGDGERQTQGDITADERIVQALRIVVKGAGWGDGLPQIQALVEPRIVVFNARGKEPFILAWGARAVSTTAAMPPDQIPGHANGKSIEDIPFASIGEAVKLGGPERLTAQSATERRAGWQKIALWVVLVAGAAALAWLALRLIREAQSGQS